MSDPKARRNIIIAVVVGVLLLIGLMNSTTDKKNPDGTYSTPWCDAHKHDQYRGSQDNETVMRYIHECRGR